MDSTFLANNPAVTTEWQPAVSVASDAFFPFSDNIEELAKINTRFITQAGGSVRDADVIAAADKFGMVMSMTGIRVFTH
jgi:AICAR transformylase/IMP cyclohydrolase PurH